MKEGAARGAVRQSVTRGVMHASKPTDAHAGQHAQALQTTGWHGLVKRPTYMAYETCIHVQRPIAALACE